MAQPVVDKANEALAACWWGFRLLMAGAACWIRFFLSLIEFGRTTAASRIGQLVNSRFG